MFYNINKVWDVILHLIPNTVFSMIQGLNKKQYKNFSLLTLSNFFFFCNFSSFFLLPLFIGKLGGNEAEIGYIMGSFGITSLLTVPVVSYLIDRFGRKKFLLFGYLLMFLSSLCFLFINELGYKIYLLRLIQGIAFAFAFTTAATSVSDFVPKEIRAYGLGIFGAFTIASYAIGPSVGEFVVDRYNYEIFFIYASAFSLISFLLSYFAKDGEFQISKHSFLKGFFNIALSKRFSPILFVNLIIAGGLGSMLNFFAAFLDSESINVSAFFLTYSITVILVRVFGGRLSDVFDRKTVAVPSMVLMAASLICIWFIKDLYSAIVVSFLFSLGYGMLYPAMSAMIIDLAFDDERGKAMGVFNMSFSFGINMLAFALGIIARDYGFKAMYIITGSFVLAGSVLFLFSRFVKIETKSYEN